MQCGDNEATIAKRVRTSAVLNDGTTTIQFTLFTEDLQKIARTVELSTPMEFTITENLNKHLSSLTITAAVKLQPVTHQSRIEKMFSLLCLHQLSDQDTNPLRKRNLKLESEDDRDEQAKRKKKD